MHQKPQPGVLVQSLGSCTVESCVVVILRVSTANNTSKSGSGSSSLILCDMSHDQVL